ncbi:MAG TPA: hypothetical protein VHO04_13185 [Sphingopyxis sp.]|uniref:hypothetical protein n=1 Tax=Sphingopyxis sp. TaxID=1908224 RepID=UPI002E336DDA|nr:hypothetical protein [Sphingopyxis sp.]HEX2813626.1 hypothetical protein [Sphingopyxis sp.]
MTIAAISAAQNASAAQADRFDLRCEGTLNTESYGSKQEEPYQTVYRIDLEQKKWCESECKALKDFNRIDATQLLFEYEDVDTSTVKSFLLNRVDRETGAHMITATSKRNNRADSILLLKWVGQCERTEFSGFPKFETKF